jgi:4-hydroxy-tetrahydrodipicolinate reductase
LDCSAALIALALGYSNPSLPVVRMEPIMGPNGRVLGFQQDTQIKSSKGLPTISLSLLMSMDLGQPEEDRITVDADPSIHAVFEGGVFGDSATAALVVNAIPRVLESTPGLHTILDIAPLRAWMPLAE